jgi:predicted nucleotidyltransferase component of viral defense system
MIDKREILETASSLGLQPSVVEKDYVLGWLLAGINAHSELTDAWVFKGGTCLKKCYFETYRFSEDLDFTLRDEAGLDHDFLLSALGEVVEWVSDQSGLTIPATQLSFDIYENPRGRKSCQGRVGYRGPVSPSSGGWPKIKLDLTADEALVLPSVRRGVFHPYTDVPEGGMWINSYAYEEAFGEKIRALGERTRPRDLYDVINLYRHGDTRPSAALLLDVLTKKCAYKNIAMPSMTSLETHRSDLEAMWDNMLGHQLPVLPPVGDFWAALPEVFVWLMGGAVVLQPSAITAGATETTIRTRELPRGIPMRMRGPLEIIRFAAANHLCVDLAYDGGTRRIEPYSLRETRDGNFVLYAVRSDSGESRSYRIDRIQGASVTNQSFNPRYLIELTTAGPLAIPLTARSVNGDLSFARVPPRPQATRTASSSPVYVYRCSVCGKTFNRKTMDGSLNEHKNPQGNPCYGRYGVYERTKY